MPKCLIKVRFAQIHKDTHRNTIRAILVKLKGDNFPTDLEENFRTSVGHRRCSGVLHDVSSSGTGSSHSLHLVCLLGLKQRYLHQMKQQKKKKLSVVETFYFIIF